MRRKPLIGLTCRWDADQRRHYLQSEYSEAVAAAGGIPVLIPLIPALAAEVVARVEGIVLTGSASDIDPARYGQPRHPMVTQVHRERDETDFAVLRHAFEKKKPVLGICFGMQSLNVHLGGTLVQDIPALVPGALPHDGPEAHHEVSVEPGSSLAMWSGDVLKIRVNSSHHQAIEKAGRDLRVTARAPDGVIEALEGTFPDHFVIAVAWHPERIWSSERLSARLFVELVSAAARHQSEPRP